MLPVLVRSILRFLGFAWTSVDLLPKHRGYELIINVHLIIITVTSKMILML